MIALEYSVASTRHELFHYVSEMHNGPKFELLLEYCVGPEPEETGGA
jgi:hypothetical protein